MVEGYITYPEEDFVKLCPVCGGRMYSDPSLVNLLELTEGQLADFEAGLWTVLICPECGSTDIWEW